MGHIHKYSMQSWVVVVLVVGGKSADFIYCCCWAVVVRYVVGRCSQTLYWYQRQIQKWLLEWLWGSTWARHCCAPTWTKALTTTVRSKKHAALRNQLAAYLRLHPRHHTSRWRWSQRWSRERVTGLNVKGGGGVIHLTVDRCNRL